MGLINFAGVGDLHLQMCDFGCAVKWTNHEIEDIESRFLHCILPEHGSRPHLLQLPDKRVLEVDDGPLLIQKWDTV
jgi:hypothetical protein